MMESRNSKKCVNVYEYRGFRGRIQPEESDACPFKLGRLMNSLAARLCCPVNSQYKGTFHFAHRLSRVLTLLESFHKVIFMEAVPLSHRVLLHWIRLVETVGFCGTKSIKLTQREQHHQAFFNP